MLSRLFSRSLSLPFKTLTLIPSSSSISSLSSLFSSNPITPHPSFLLHFLRSFSSKGNGDGDGDGSWTFSPEPDTAISSVFGEGAGTFAGIAEEGEAPNEGGRSELKAADPWAEEEKGDIFEGIDKEMLPKVGGGGEEWETAEGYEPWSLGGGGDGDGEKGDVFGIEDVGIEGIEGIDGVPEKSEEMMELERKGQELLATLNGPNRAFGDLIAASGITEDMIDSLILLKDVRGIPGLPSLHEIEDKAIERLNATSSRAEIERKKQEEIAKARVRQVDEKGRAYGTGRRRCGIARVWIQPGDSGFNQGMGNSWLMTSSLMHTSQFLIIELSFFARSQ